jgi:hypothetical protein
MTINVGDEICKALLRAEDLERTCPRRLRVRLMTRYGGDIARRTGVLFGEENEPDVPLGLLISAHIAVRGREEMDRQQHHSCANEILILWSELDARATELTRLVEQCVAACEKALGIVREPATA